MHAFIGHTHWEAIWVEKIVCSHSKELSKNNLPPIIMSMCVCVINRQSLGPNHQFIDFEERKMKGALLSLGFQSPLAHVKLSLWWEALPTLSHSFPLIPMAFLPSHTHTLAHLIFTFLHLSSFDMPILGHLRHVCVLTLRIAKGNIIHLSSDGANQWDKSLTLALLSARERERSDDDA